MMQRSLNLFLGLALALSAAACAGTKQEAASPEAEQASFGDTTASSRSRTTSLPEPAPSIPDSLVQNQQAKQVPQPMKDPAAGNGVADAKTLEAQEEAKAEAEANARDAAKWQKLGREQDRKNTDEYARDRLAKATTRVTTTQNQSSRIQGNRRLKLTHDVNEFDAKRVDVKARIDGLAATGSDEWKITKEGLDEALNDLDALSFRVEGDL